MLKDHFYCLLLLLPLLMTEAVAQSEAGFTAQLAVVNQAGQSGELELIRERVIAELLREEVNKDEISRLLQSIRDDGSWPGIDYEDTTKTGFQHSEHLSNMLKLGLAYRQPSSAFFGDAALKKTLDTSLHFWLQNDFICENWWWNQIGTPRSIGQLLLIMDEALSDQQKEGAAAIMSRATLDAWGARPGGDLIKIAGIYGKYGLFLRDTAILAKVMKVIPAEIQYASDRGTPSDLRGLQHDMGFHHRQDRVTSTLSYGLGYAEAFAEWAALVAGTKYAFPDKAIRLLVDFYLDGICKTMVHAKYPDPGAKNRSITRRGTLSAENTGLPEKLLLSTDYRQQELQEIISIRKGEALPSLESNRFYWHSEYLSHQRPDFFASVRMYSSRNHNMEQPYNGEGLKNHHLADGSNFISRTGREYLDIFPLWDWQKVPGTTVVQKPTLPAEDEIQKKGLTDFVGAVSDGKYGAAAFDFKSVHDDLQARKAWFFFDDKIVCLGAGIRSGENFPVATTLNQSWLEGEVVVSDRNKTRMPRQGLHKLKNVDWVYHDGVGYFFPERAEVRLSNREESGSWRSINRQADSPDEEVRGEVFSLWLDHGKKPLNESYAYFVLPAIEKSQLQEQNPAKYMEILSNTNELQAVRHHELQMVQAVFYRAGKISITEELQISVNHPSILLLQMNGSEWQRLSVADPGRKLEEIEISVSGRLQGEGNGYVVSWQEEAARSLLSVKLPKGQMAGQSVVIPFSEPGRKADKLE